MARFRHRLHVSLGGALVLGAIVTLGSSTPLARQAAQERPWHGFSGTASGSRHFPNSQIDKSNVSRLEVAWTYPYSDTVSTPMMARGMIRPRPQRRAGGARRPHRPGDLGPRKDGRHDVAA